MEKYFFYLLLYVSSLLSHDVWMDISVSQPDNLNAISSNPAGLGISRGKQSGFLDCGRWRAVAIFSAVYGDEGCHGARGRGSQGELQKSHASIIV